MALDHTSRMVGVDLNHLTETERDAIMMVLRRDEDLRNKEQERVRKLRSEVKAIKLKGVIRDGDDADNSCARCREKFGWIFNKGAICPKCHHRVCEKCRKDTVNGEWLCVLCVKQKEIDAMTGIWFYSRFRKSKRNAKTNRIITGNEIVRSSIRRKHPPPGVGRAQSDGPPQSAADEVRQAMSNNNTSPKSQRSLATSSVEEEQLSDTQSMEAMRSPNGTDRPEIRIHEHDVSHPSSEDRQILFNLMNSKPESGSDPRDSNVMVRRVTSKKYHSESSSSESETSSPQMSPRAESSFSYGDSLRSSIRSVDSTGRITMVTESCVSDIDLQSIQSDTSPSMPRKFQSQDSVIENPAHKKGLIDVSKYTVNKPNHSEKGASGGREEEDSMSSPSEDEYTTEQLTKVKFRRVSTKKKNGKSPISSPTQSPIPHKKGLRPQKETLKEIAKNDTEVDVSWQGESGHLLAQGDTSPVTDGQTGGHTNPAAPLHVMLSDTAHPGAKLGVGAGVSMTVDNGVSSSDLEEHSDEVDHNDHILTSGDEPFGRNTISGVVDRKGRVPYSDKVTVPTTSGDTHLSDEEDSLDEMEWNSGVSHGGPFERSDIAENPDLLRDLRMAVAANMSSIDQSSQRAEEEEHDTQSLEQSEDDTELFSSENVIVNEEGEQFDHTIYPNVNRFPSMFIQPEDLCSDTLSVITELTEPDHDDVSKNTRLDVDDTRSESTIENDKLSDICLTPKQIRTPEPESTSTEHTLSVPSDHSKKSANLSNHPPPEHPSSEQILKSTEEWVENNIGHSLIVGNTGIYDVGSKGTSKVPVSEVKSITKSEDTVHIEIQVTPPMPAKKIFIPPPMERKDTITVLAEESILDDSEIDFADVYRENIKYIDDKELNDVKVDNIESLESKPVVEETKKEEKKKSVFKALKKFNLKKQKDADEKKEIEAQKKAKKLKEQQEIEAQKKAKKLREEKEKEDKKRAAALAAESKKVVLREQPGRQKIKLMKKQQKEEMQQDQQSKSQLDVPDGDEQVDKTSVSSVSDLKKMFDKPPLFMMPSRQEREREETMSMGKTAEEELEEKSSDREEDQELLELEFEVKREKERQKKVQEEENRAELARLEQEIEAETNDFLAQLNDGNAKPFADETKSNPDIIVASKEIDVQAEMVFAASVGHESTMHNTSGSEDTAFAESLDMEEMRPDMEFSGDKTYIVITEDEPDTHVPITPDINRSTDVFSDEDVNLVEERSIDDSEMKDKSPSVKRVRLARGVEEVEIRNGHDIVRQVPLSEEEQEEGEGSSDDVTKHEAKLSEIKTKVSFALRKLSEHSVSEEDLAELRRVYESGSSQEVSNETDSQSDFTDSQDKADLESLDRQPITESFVFHTELKSESLQMDRDDDSDSEFHISSDKDQKHVSIIAVTDDSEKSPAPSEESLDKLDGHFVTSTPLHNSSKDKIVEAGEEEMDESICEPNRVEKISVDISATIHADAETALPQSPRQAADGISSCSFSEDDPRVLPDSPTIEGLDDVRSPDGRNDTEDTVTQDAFIVWAKMPKEEREAAREAKRDAKYEHSQNTEQPVKTASSESHVHSQKGAERHINKKTKLPTSEPVSKLQVRNRPVPKSEGAQSSNGYLVAPSPSPNARRKETRSLTSSPHRNNTDGKSVADSEKEVTRSIASIPSESARSPGKASRQQSQTSERSLLSQTSQTSSISSVPSIAITAHNTSHDSLSDKSFVMGGEEENIDELFASHTSATSTLSLHSRLKSPFSDSRESISSFYSDAGEGSFGNIPVTGDIMFGVDYNYKLGSLEVKIKQCRDLAIVDQKKKRTDPYVKTYLLPDKTKSGKRKTRCKKHTVNPVFDETLKYLITKSELETRTLWVTVWHNDSFGRNDFLGEVTIPLDYYAFDEPTPQWYKLKERLSNPLSLLTYKGDLILAVKFISADNVGKRSGGKKSKGELHCLVKEARNLTAVGSNGYSDPFCKAYLLPDKSTKVKQKTPVVKKDCNPQWNYTFVFPDISLDELAERSLELTIWDHDRMLSNAFLGGVRLNLGRGKHGGKDADWMDAHGEEISLWHAMLERPNCWMDGSLMLRPHMGKQK